MLSTDVRFLHDVLEARATEDPTAIAVSDAVDSLTYAQVWDRATKLAAALTEAGAEPEVPVGVCLHRTTSLLVSFFAVVSAGAPYLPLDPGNPLHRLDEIVTTSGARIVISEPEFDALLPASMRVLRPNDAATAITSPGPVSSDNAAYVLFTSGSTGGPKGVVVTHRNALHLLEAQRRAALVPDGSSVIGFASIGFDASIWEMLLAVGSASPLQFATRGIEDLPSGPDYVATLVPSVLEQLDPQQVQYSSVISAGERLSAALAERWAHGRSLRNAYGPTETTVCATITGTLTNVGADPAIGQEFGDATVKILDHAADPDGDDIGELAVGGSGVARGYFGSPGLTAARFVPDPEGAPGSRMYRTGDLVKRDADGNLVFVGRRDGQVKLNGMRLELGEIERALRAVDGVRTACALFESVAGSPRRLSAVVVRDGNTPDATGVAEQLALRLPPHMIPSTVTFVDSLPLTLNGKLDVSAVLKASTPTDEPSPGLGHPARDLIAALFRDVLGVEHVGAGDHFFTLGGHSLLATRLIARLRTVLRRPVPARTLFRNPVLADFADAVHDLPTDDADAPGDRFWTELYEDVPSVLGVPVVTTGEPSSASPGASAEFTLNDVTAEDIESLACDAMATAPMVYVAAFAQALQLTGGTAEVLIALGQGDGALPLRLTERIGDLVADGIPSVRDEIVAAFFTDRDIPEATVVQSAVTFGDGPSGGGRRALELAVSHSRGPVVLRLAASAQSGLEGHHLDAIAAHLNETLDGVLRPRDPEGGDE
ncbi:amino acid adenylation domain-containing protein [Streptomyces violaceusniger]